MNLALMQPYVFPYVGYFHLIWKSDTFIFYDDVSFIKQGWINRNRILVNSSAHLFVVPCRNASSNRQIRDVGVDNSNPKYRKLPKLLYSTYQNAPYFNEVFPILERVFKAEYPSIGHLAATSVIRCCEYLEIFRTFLFSSQSSGSTADLSGQERVIAIAKQHGAATYLNSPGGRKLYEDKAFLEYGIKLEFISPRIVEYQQFKNDFVPGLSIIDILMFNSPSTVRDLIASSMEDHA